MKYIYEIETGGKTASVRENETPEMRMSRVEVSL
jgi:hypothetical protein